MGAVTALDIGGSHVTAARVDTASARVEGRRRTDLSPGSELVEIVRAARGARAPLVGVAVPGPFDYAAGISAITHKLRSLHGVDLRRELAAALALEPEAVVFLNDAEAFLLGEAWVGAAAGRRRAVGITLGTGLGSAFLVDDRLVDTGPPLYLLPFRGAPVEDALSSSAFRARFGAGARSLAGQARRGDERARAAFAAFAGDLTAFLVPRLAPFAPDVVVVGGSIARAWDLLAPTLEAELPAARAANLDDAALLGAARRAALTRAA